jgi:hypothetical protein
MDQRQRFEALGEIQRNGSLKVWKLRDFDK